MGYYDERLKHDLDVHVIVTFENQVDQVVYYQRGWIYNPRFSYAGSKIFGELFQRFLNLPSVLGELITGLIIGPYALGGISFFGLEPLFGIDSSSHSSSVVGNELLFS
mgnify:CR=1 FL=1